MSGKIKAINPEIIVDIADKRYHIGYGSYYYGNVIEWLKEYFEPIQADEQPVVHGQWEQVDETKCRCSHCGIIALIGLYPHGDKNFCPNCGAKMDEEG